MSGSGGGFGGGASDDAPIACERLIIETAISSPKEAVIKNLSINDVLQVELEQLGATSIVVLTYQGGRAGGITHAQTNRLRECIHAGTKYIEPPRVSWRLLGLSHTVSATCDFASCR